MNFYTNFPKIWYINFGDWMKKETFIDENKTTSERVSPNEFFNEVFSILNKTEGLGGISDYYNFLIKRENKLQMIEQMFKSGSVDLGDLAALVEEKWKR